MATLLRVSLLGSLPNGEEWTVNPVWAISDFGTPTTPAQIQAVATALAASAVATGLTASWSSNTFLNGYRVEARTNAGVLENQAEALRTAPIAGTGSSVHPLQSAIVCSLRTAQVGASGRGRMYLPATGIALLTTLGNRPAQSVQDALLAGIKTTLGTMQTTIRTTFASAALAVWSRKQVATFNVNRIQIGDVMDSQRRRRDALIENYTSTTYP